MSINLPQNSFEQDQQVYWNLVNQYGKKIVDAAQRLLDEQPDLVGEISEDYFSQLQSAIGIVTEDTRTWLGNES